MWWWKRRQLAKQLDTLTPAFRAWAERGIDTADHFHTVVRTMPNNDLRDRAEDGLSVIDELAERLVTACLKADALGNANDPARTAALARQLRDAEWGAANAPDPAVRQARRNLLEALRQEAETIADVQATYRRLLAELQTDYARLTALGAEVEHLAVNLAELDGDTPLDTATQRALDRLQAAREASHDITNPEPANPINLSSLPEPAPPHRQRRRLHDDA